MYIVIFPCIFEPKSKVPVTSRSMYQLLYTLRNGERGDMLKYAKPFSLKKGFPCLLTICIFSPKGQVGKAPRFINIILLNKNLQQREVDFISKYGNYNANNCLLNLDSQIENVNKYNNVENREENKNPYAEILKEEEIESIKDRFSRRQKKIGKGKIRENLFNVKEHLEEAFMNKAYTFVQELEEEDVNSVRALAFKK